LFGFPKLPNPLRRSHFHFECSKLLELSESKQRFSLNQQLYWDTVIIIRFQNLLYDQIS
jgi:hypothetical protein